MMGWSGVSELGWRKGPWTPEEDKLLKEYVSSYGEGRWSSVSRCAGLNRSGKSCRLRWVNYLRPGLKIGNITPQEEGIIIELHALWGNKWSTIARYLPGRTDNEVKNYWRTHFKKKSKLSQEKRKIIQKTQKQQEEKYEPRLEPESNASVSPVSDITSDPQMLFLPHQQQTPFTNIPNYYNMENQNFTPAPAVNNDVTELTPESIPLDGLWGWLWNIDDQNEGGAQIGGTGKMYNNEGFIF